MSLYIGLDLGGTFLKYSLGDEKGKLLHKAKCPSHGQETADVIFETIFTAIEELLSMARQEGKTVEAIGMGSPSVIDVDNGKLIGKSPNLPYWVDIEIAKTIQQKFSIPTYVDNDANIMTVAEMQIGAGKGYKNSICVTVGTGVGGGLYINGEIYRGSWFAGAEIGHIVIEVDGKYCTCGGRGCLEEYAAAPAIVADYASKLEAQGKQVPENLDTKIIFENAKQGEKIAVEAMENGCRYLGAGLAGVVNLLNPEIVIIGGGVSGAGSIYIDCVADVIRNRAMPTASNGLVITGAVLGNDAGMIGAILYAAAETQKKK